MRQYNDVGRALQTLRPATCPDVNTLKAADVHGEWRLALPQVNYVGQMRLSQHPEFSESLRGNLAYGAVQSIASGDVNGGNFDLDESSDGKRMTGTWSGKLTPGACGNEIRGTWTELDRDLRSTFVLTRVGTQTTPMNDGLPEGVRVLPVPDPSLN